MVHWSKKLWLASGLMAQREDSELDEWQVGMLLGKRTS